MDSQESTTKFYDEFSYKQVKTGKNLRHYIIAKNLKSRGIRKSRKILEMGCGIGTLTDLLQHIAPNAEITALDISPKNIEIASSRVKSKRVNFVVADISENLTFDEKFDFIILADVIEHIPVEHYHLLFYNLKRLSHSNTKIFINIPHPNLIKYLKETKPESLQIVDQSVYPTILYQHLDANQFVIDEKRDYCIFHQTPDYCYYWLSPLSEKTFINYNKTISLPIRILYKIFLRITL